MSRPSGARRSRALAWPANRQGRDPHGHASSSSLGSERRGRARRFPIDTAATAAAPAESAGDFIDAPCPDNATLDAIDAAACEFIREAGTIVLERYGGPLAIDYKGGGKNDPVTEADRAVEAFLTGAVAERFPDHAVLGEEGQDPTGDPTFEWIVDPIDGTINFINRLPFFAISIGILHRRRPVAGAILFPVTGDLLHARRGGGAFRGDERLQVSQAAEAHPSVLAGVPSAFPFQFKAGRSVRRKLGEPRSLGSIAYEMGVVARGAFGYAVFGAPKIWDVAGGVTIVREAGGTVLRYSRSRGGWFPLERFIAPPPPAADQPRTLRTWSGAVLVGAPPIVAGLAPHLTPRRAPVALTAAMRRYQGWRKIAREAKEREKQRREEAGDTNRPVGELTATAEPDVPAAPAGMADPRDG
jgi:myo-inositol-1(or 4)-monophosphatase